MLNRGNLKIKQTQGKCQDIQLLECTECGTTFSERRGSVYFGLKKPDYLFDQVMMLLMMRASMKDISRFTNLHEDTIARWAKKAAAFLNEIQDYLLKNLNVEECQIDEMWSFVYMKNKTAKRKGITETDDICDQWIFIAFDARNKLIIHWKIGKRTLETAKEFIKELKEKLDSNPLFTTDELPAYEEAFLSNFCTEIPVEKTGKKGRPAKTVRVVDPELKLAQVHKHRKNGRVENITERIIFGDKEEIEKILEGSPVSNSINTSFIERANGTIRNKVSSLVRKTYSFCKTSITQHALMGIYCVFYNFIWIHSRLKKTPAVMSGIVDKTLRFRDLFNIRSAEFICGH